MVHPEYLVIALSTLGLILRTQAAQFRTAYHRATAKEKRQRSLRASEAQARRQAEEAAQAKAQFLAHLSHEVRTPLHAISGAAQMLRQTETTAEQQAYLDVLATGSETLQAILGDILDYARIEAGKIELEPQPVNTAEAIEQALSLVQAQATARRLQFVKRIESDAPCTVVADPIRLRQILLNLLTNAVKFTPSGAITITASRCTAGDNQWLQIAVSDTGCGIALQHQPTLFQPFTQAPAAGPNRGGAGLGLAISKELVTLMGGEIWLESKPGQGATFTFTLPLEA